MRASLLLGVLATTYRPIVALHLPAACDVPSRGPIDVTLSTNRRAWIKRIVAFVSASSFSKSALAEDTELDSLTRELLARTAMNKAKNEAAVTARLVLSNVPFGGIGQSPAVDSARLSPAAEGLPVRFEEAADKSLSNSEPLLFRVEPYDAAVDSRVFRSQAFGKEEYNNAFAASENTNVSPKEAYDTILSKVAPKELEVGGAGRPLRVLDLGAGAGVSTEVNGLATYGIS
jgi:hypothetical protein